MLRCIGQPFRAFLLGRAPWPALGFTAFGLVRTVDANRAIVAETIVVAFGGIVGTLHPPYFTGTPTSAIAVG